MKSIKISIITPVFNSIDFIENCIKNIIDQKCNGLEHLIIDGGSTDGTLEIIKEYAQKYSHIKWISEKDQGQSDAMNKGIIMAKAEVISFLNADDAYNPFTLNRVIDIFNGNQSLNFITGNCKVFDLNGKLIYINRPQRIKSYHLFSFKETFPINPVAYFYKKTIHENIGYYTVENHHNMDYEFILKASLKNNLIYFNEDWGYALQHENAKTAIDIADNTMFIRKKETFDLVYKLASLKVKVLSFLYRLYKTVQF